VDSVRYILHKSGTLDFDSSPFQACKRTSDPSGNCRTNPALDTFIISEQHAGNERANMVDSYPMKGHVLIKLKNKLKLPCDIRNHTVLR